jgi:peptide/nickel transport system permease protein
VPRPVRGAPAARPRRGGPAPATRRAGGFWRAYRRQRGGLAGLAVLLLSGGLALAAPLFIGADDLSASRAPGLPREPPSRHLLLGADAYGRSMVEVTIWGARISLAVGLLATILAVGIGGLLGLLAGHFRGWLGMVVMRVTDWFIVLPTLVLASALASLLRPGVATVIVALGVTSWPGTTRLVRAQTLSVQARPYLERSRALGAGHWHIITRHLLPAVLPLVLAQSTLAVAGAILGEATLAFLGLSDPTQVSWGTTLQLARDVGAISAGDWWILLPPGLAIAAVSLSFTLCGRALEAVVNPRPAGGGLR